MNMAIVYVVTYTDGYSDYAIVDICSTHDRALKVIKAHEDNENYAIKEIVIDKKWQLIALDLKLYHIIMDINGERECKEVEIEDWDNHEENKPVFRYAPHSPGGTNIKMEIFIFAASEKPAVINAKAFAERLEESGEWAEEVKKRKEYIALANQYYEEGRPIGIKIYAVTSSA